MKNIKIQDFDFKLFFNFGADNSALDIAVYFSTDDVHTLNFVL